ncbi:phosphotransferase enzyme family protein [Candidatus Bipolaricaulota bacterium]
MKPYEDLTRQGRVLRLREVAGLALKAFGMPDADYRFNHDSGNVSFRVRNAEETRKRSYRELFEPGHYVLRLHQDDYQETQAIRSELAWLEALGHAGLPVPAPVRSVEGQLLVEIAHPGMPVPRRCSLLCWVKGRMTEKGIGPNHVRAMGQAMARMHEQAASWSPPDGFERWHYTWEGLFGASNVAGVSLQTAQAEILDSVRVVYDEVTAALAGVMGALGTGADAFGLIHADLSLGANVLFWKGEARPIDFDDCSFGYWMFDAGVALSGLRARSNWPLLRDAFLSGYLSVRSMPEDQWRHHDLFIAAWHAFEIFWAAADICKYPQWKAGSERWQQRAGKDLQAILAER